MHEEVQQGKKKKKKLPRCPKNNKVHQKESKKPQKVYLLKVFSGEERGEE
jgi:hypothetical protein